MLRLMRNINGLGWQGENTPIHINEKPYFITSYKVETGTKTINLIPIAADAAFKNIGQNAIFEDIYTYRSGSCYIALPVNDEDFKDLLKEDDSSHKAVFEPLDLRHKEYLSTSNYIEIYLSNE